MNCLECNILITESNTVLTYGRTGKTYRRKKCKSCINKRISKMVTKRRSVVGSKTWLNHRFYRLKKNAIRRNKEFLLDYNEVKEIYEETKCYYCKETCKIRTIDRVNNSLGYTKSNCVMACFECNRLKGTFLVKDKQRLLRIIESL